MPWRPTGPDRPGSLSPALPRPTMQSAAVRPLNFLLWVSSAMAAHSPQRALSRYSDSMTIPLIDLAGQYASIREEIAEALDALISSQRFILGPEVEALEADLASYVGVRHAIGVASGTDALLLSLKALDADPGSAVVVPSFTFFASAGAVWNAGFRPVFCDVDPDTFNVTPETLEAAWTDRTVAVVVVHLFGQMADMVPIRALAHSRGAFVLEDAAQAIGARSCSGSAGSVGDAGAFSFFPTKNLGGFGDGGLVTTQVSAFAD